MARSFTFRVELEEPSLSDIRNTALSGGAYTQADTGKAIKLDPANVGCHTLAAGGDEIEGFIVAVEDFTTNQGKSFGTYKRNGRVEVEVGASQVGAIAVGNLVVADGQAAAGTDGNATVQVGAPAAYKWRVLSIVTGDGTSGSTVCVERV